MQQIADKNGKNTMSLVHTMGERRFGRVNWLGVRTLVLREVLRFLKVYSQTLVAPVATAALFLAVFTLALAGQRGEVLGQPFAAFVAPGTVMMAVIQNSFANTSSSIIIAKVQGNIVDTLMPPLSPAELTAGFALGGAARGIAVALLAGIFLFPATGVGAVAPLWLLVFAVLGSVLLALIGLAAGIWADKFDHVAAVTNFIVTPLSFLSGTFYSLERLPEAFQTFCRVNPFFYLIDGFRYGALGVSDASPWTGLLILLACIAFMGWLCWRMFTTGYRLKN